MTKPLPEEADSTFWPKMLVDTAEQLMDTTLFTVAAYTSAGVISVWPSTDLTLTAEAVRPVSWMAVLPVLRARDAPPKPHRPPTKAQHRTRAVTLVPVFFQKLFPFVLGIRGSS